VDGSIGRRAPAVDGQAGSRTLKSREGSGSWWWVQRGQTVCTSGADSLAAQAQGCRGRVCRACTSINPACGNRPSHGHDWTSSRHWEVSSSTLDPAQSCPLLEHQRGPWGRGRGTCIDRSRGLESGAWSLGAASSSRHTRHNDLSAGHPMAEEEERSPVLALRRCPVSFATCVLTWAMTAVLLGTGLTAHQGSRPPVCHVVLYMYLGRRTHVREILGEALCRNTSHQQRQPLAWFGNLRPAC
jgi:hypothetical protein